MIVTKQLTQSKQGKMYDNLACGINYQLFMRFIAFLGSLIVRLAIDLTDWQPNCCIVSLVASLTF